MKHVGVFYYKVKDTNIKQQISNYYLQILNPDTTPFTFIISFWLTEI